MFHNSRSKQFVYVPTSEILFTALDQHADSLEGDSKPPLVITGAEGTGKSALLANWVSRRADHAHKEEFLFEFFAGSFERSSHLTYLLHNLEKELKHFFQLREMVVPDTEEGLRWSLNRFLTAAAKKYSPARIVIVIDGVNRIKSESGVTGSLHWLPAELPAGVRIIVSTVEFVKPNFFEDDKEVNRTFMELTRRKCPVLRMEPLSVNTRQRIITLFLEQHHETFSLNEAEQFKIVTITQTAQPLFLRILLQSLKLETEIKGCTSAIINSTLDMIARCQSAYDIVEQSLNLRNSNVDTAASLKQVLCNVYVSRDGLSEEEIWGLLELILRVIPDDEMKQSLLMILRDMTMVVEGRYCFSHDTHTEAIYKKYIATNSNLIKIHLDLAKFFTILPASPRKLVCLPYHLEIAGIWSKVKNCLTDIDNFKLWWTAEFKSDFIKFWAGLTMTQDPNKLSIGTEKPTFDIVDEYVKSLEEYRLHTHPHPSDEEVANIVLDIADFMIEFATLGHEATADVPMNIHPVCPSEDLKQIGVPHITVEDGRSTLWYPAVFSTATDLGRDAKKIDADEPVKNVGATKAVEDIPMRTTYYFSRWMWIQFPLIALGNVGQRYITGVADKDTEFGGRGRPKTSQQKLKEKSMELDADDSGMTEVEKLARQIGFRPKTTGGMKGVHGNPNKLKLPEVKFVRRAARSFRRVPLEEDGDGAAGKIEQRMISLQDSIRNYREEFDFLYQNKLILEKRLYGLKGSLVDLLNAKDSMGQFDGTFLDTGHKDIEATAKYSAAKQEHDNLKKLDLMCTRHPPHMPAIIVEVENKIDQDAFLLEEIKKRLFEQHFEHQAHNIFFKEMKNLAQSGVDMHTKLLDYRYTMQKVMQKNATADQQALISTAQPGKTRKMKKTKVLQIKDMENREDDDERDDESKKGERPWAEVWKVVSYRTGITEPEIFFQRLQSRSQLENQMKTLKKAAESRLEALNEEVAFVETELEDISYEASFAGAKGNDTADKKKLVNTLHGNLKRSKERTSTYETLRKSATEGLKHVAEILGIKDEEEDLEKVHINDLVREIEVTIDALVEEYNRVEAIAAAAGTKETKEALGVTGSGVGTMDMSVAAEPRSQLNEPQQIPRVLKNALNRVETFRPRVPETLPSRFVDVAKGKENGTFEDFDFQRSLVKNASLKIIRTERVKEARKAKETADMQAKAER